MAKKVSVLMPVYNVASTQRDHFCLSAAIDSIITQDYEDWELIIANDGSTDGTREVLEKFELLDSRIHVMNLERNVGIGGALNAAAGKAQGDYLARMDADDMSVVYRLSTQVDLLNNQPGIGITGAGMWVLNPDDQIIMEVVRPSSHDDILRFCIGYGCPFVHGSVMMRRSVFEEAGGYSAREAWAAEDFELWYRILSITNGYNFPEPMYFYRQSPKGLFNSNLSRISLDTERVVKLFHDRFGPSVLCSGVSW